MPPRTPVGPEDDENASTPEDPEAAGGVDGQSLDAATQQAINEALLEQLAQEQNAWAYVDAIEYHHVPPELRHMYYTPFIALVAREPQAEQDALIDRGRPIFRYRMETVRRDIAGLRDTGAERTKIVPFVVGSDFLADIILTPEGVRFAIYRGGEVEIADRVQIAETIYLPPQSQLVGTDTGAVLLPTGVEEYGDEQMLFRELRHFIGQYVYVNESGFRNVMAHYVLLTWIYDKFDALPYLRAQGEPEPQPLTANLLP